MILVLGGTTEANQITKELLKNNLEVTVSCSTSNGKEIAQSRAKNNRMKVITGEMNDKALVKLIKTNNFKAVIDATHPFAELITENAIKACKAATVPYYRYERKPFQVKENSFVHVCSNYEEASNTAFNLGKNIFLTIGVKNINKFTEKADSLKKEIFARVLNQESSIAKCLEAGVKKENIIACKGPFSVTQNINHFNKYRSDVVVSKDSGINGGLSEKIGACKELKIPAILVKRPSFQKNAIFEIDELLNKVGVFE
jgi:precorrin-6A/cobalt-precorrin-6A reductase